PICSNRGRRAARNNCWTRAGCNTTSASMSILTLFCPAGCTRAEWPERDLCRLEPVHYAAGSLALPDNGEQMADIKTETVTYSAGGKTLQSHLAYDATRTGKRPGIIVLSEWWGRNDYIKRRDRELAELGYV